MTEAADDQQPAVIRGDLVNRALRVFLAISQKEAMTSLEVEETGWKVVLCALFEIHNGDAESVALDMLQTLKSLVPRLRDGSVSAVAEVLH